LDNIKKKHLYLEFQYEDQFLKHNTQDTLEKTLFWSITKDGTFITTGQPVSSGSFLRIVNLDGEQMTLQYTERIDVGDPSDFSMQFVNVEMEVMFKKE